MSGSHYAPEPTGGARPSSGPVGTLQQWMARVEARLAVLETAAAERAGDAGELPGGALRPDDGDEATRYDLPAPSALHPLTDIAALREEIARIAKQLNRLTTDAMSDLGRTAHDVDRLRGAVDAVNRIAVTVETQGAAHERRLAALERTVGALERTAAHQVDALQVLMGRLEDGK